MAECCDQLASLHAQGAPPVKRSYASNPELKRIIRGVISAGITVHSVEALPDGTIRLSQSAPDQKPRDDFEAWQERL